ncbi:hypothetical protein GIB67_029366 [Kingdonia uniflora]|uniref:Uncharacterized protein n=1 Tax=Kingdonia uniflora TaxID=39325 RepID=A0A7J7NSQ6_9MAGN|nr:hypothetical protein GIB67_029366 [Kingdonia uniflora]
MLLNYVRGPSSFDHLLIVNGVIYRSFKRSAEAMGMLEDDKSSRECMEVAVVAGTTSVIHKLFATLFVYYEPAKVSNLWRDYKTRMAHDYRVMFNFSDTYIEMRLLKEINNQLSQHSKSFTDYDLHTLKDAKVDCRGLIF